MPKTLSAAEAKTHLAEALRLVEAGEIVEITRYGKPVAGLVGAERVHGLTMVTANKRHYERVPGLELEIFTPGDAG